MSRLIPVTLALGVLALGGCKKEPEKPKTAEQVVEEAAQMTRPQPGLYKTAMKVAKFEIPGMPPAEVAQLQKLIGGTAQAREFCLTKAEAEKGFEDFGKKMAQGDCTYERFEASSDSLDAKMTCKTGQGMSSTVELTGTMGATASKMTMKMQSGMPGVPGQQMQMEAEVTSERIGDCPGA